LDIVLGLRKFFHDRTMTDLGSRTDRRLVRYVGVTKEKLNGRSGQEGAATAVAERAVRRCGGGPVQRPIADPGSPWGGP
jgi:hypothetical protein